MVIPMTLPARFALDILEIAEAMEQNTIGTTTQNMRFINTVPRGASFEPSEGFKAPTRQPATMPVSMNNIKP